MLELMARGGMRIGEVLNLTPADIQESVLSASLPISATRVVVYSRGGSVLGIQIIKRVT